MQFIHINYYFKEGFFVHKNMLKGYVPLSNQVLILQNAAKYKTQWNIFAIVIVSIC